MTAAERIESPREKGYLLYFFNVKGADLKLVFAYETVNVFQHGGVVKEIQLAFPAVFVQRENTFAAVAENIVFFPKRKAERTEYVLAYGPQRFLTDSIVVVGKAADYQADQLVFAGKARLSRFGVSEDRLIYIVVFRYYAKGMEYRRRHLSVGGAEEFFEIGDELVKLSRRQMEHDHAQIVRNIF